MSNKHFIPLLIIILLVISGCANQLRGPGKTTTYETFAINTSDNITLAVNYYPSTSDKGLILLHMMAKSKESFHEEAKRLQEHYKIVVPDLRGHGDSDFKAYNQLTEDDYQNMIYDVEVVAEYLEQEGAKSISLAGASIGANLAMLYAAEHEVDKLLMISPGSRLKGLNLFRINYEKPLLIQVGHYDAYSSISVDDLELQWMKARVMDYDSSAHGTDLIHNDISAQEDFYFYLT